MFGDLSMFNHNIIYIYYYLYLYLYLTVFDCGISRRRWEAGFDQATKGFNRRTVEFDENRWRKMISSATKMERLWPTNRGILKNYKTIWNIPVVEKNTTDWSKTVQHINQWRISSRHITDHLGGAIEQVSNGWLVPNACANKLRKCGPTL